MKTLPVIIAASLLVASFGASAQINQRTESGTIATNVASSKVEAFKLGANKLSQLKSGSAQDLENAVVVHSGYADLSTLRLNDGAFVTVEQRVSEDGKPGFVGLLNVDYSYTEIDD